MPYLKKLVIKGFKSFARETTIHLDEHINVIVGPNGSGKSNITDALCFVLGRLSIKSMRAAKASHLIFSGNKQFKGANEAFVEIVLDNKDKIFALNTEEIKIKRIVRKNGQSIYKINDETKTRQEVLELLSQGGIDPHGFNIILQGEIEKFVKMPGEDRRKVIEEVAGISVYEMRKEKSLKELEKTEEKLKQINAVLRERTNYLKNLENEREQALRFKKLEFAVKQYKASILNRKIQDKQKELNEIENKIESKKQEVLKKEQVISKTQEEINLLNDKANEISKKIQTSSGLEQDTLLNEISTLKQEIAGLTARKENFENQLTEIERRKQSLLETIKESEKEIEEMMKEKGKDRKKELDSKKAKLEELKELKRQYYLLKSNFSSLTSQVEDKKIQIQRLKNESNFTLNQIEQLEGELRIKNSLEGHQEALVKLKESLKNNKQEIEQLRKTLLENERHSAIKEQEIKKAEQIQLQVSKLDICPLCKTKMTEEHLKEVHDKTNKDISDFKEILKNLAKDISEKTEKIQNLESKISKDSLEINTREIDIIKLKNISEKKEQLKRNKEQIESLETEHDNLEKKKKSTEEKLAKTRMGEENYETLELEVNELQRTEERNLGMEISTKQRELERMKLAVKQNIRDKEEIETDLKGISEDLEEKTKITEEKDEQAEILKRKYQKMFEEKNNLQDKIRMFETNLMKQQNEKRLSENDINNYAITRAQINAKKETLIEEIKAFPDMKFIPISIEKLEVKLRKVEDILARIGSVNLRALEVYEGIKAEYDKIKEKVDQLEKEKSEILKVIEQIDRKKRKTFLNTLNDVNELFSRNFSQLSEKGIVTLEPQDKKDVFAAGIDIIVKVGGGKYFDVTSLSGGEQTLVALSLIFAIQEFRPYCFYIFDEIDAALDRRNSEKLAYLLKKYMKEGQYLIITHNDSIISESSSVLYGVSMQEGVSKVLSLEV
ncbi:MAG: chromosome segregation SMC family protein [Candidatus Pacearchaeota archaeon]